MVDKTAFSYPRATLNTASCTLIAASQVLQDPSLTVVCRVRGTRLVVTLTSATNLSHRIPHLAPIYFMSQYLHELCRSGEPPMGKWRVSKPNSSISVSPRSYGASAATVTQWVLFGPNGSSSS